jgi:hypothetical protein
MRDVAGALRWLEAQRRTPTPPRPPGSWLNRCLQLARSAYDVAALHPEADQAWAATRFRTQPQERPPAGWLVWWDRPGHPANDNDAGHVAVSAGDGLCWSNDVKRRGGVDLVRIDAIGRAWGLPRVGDSRDINGRLVVVTDERVPPHPHAPKVVRVKAGDTLSELVARHGNVVGIGWQDVWRDPHNAGLRAKRKRPGLIRPGDHVWIP